MSVCGTVPWRRPLEIISWRHGSLEFAPQSPMKLPFTTQLNAGICLRISSPRGLDRVYRRPAPIHLTRHPFSISSKRYWTMNQFPISYALQPRLRGRLTLGRRPLPRKPRAFGERDSHPSFRYSYRHTLFCCLQRAFQLAFAGLQNAPLPLRVVSNAKDATSVPGLSLVTSSAHHYSTSELLRTLSRNGCF